jgi:putative addiction module component (TIGR02574 family)
MDIRSLDISQLTRQEQLDLIERLWEAIDTAGDELPPAGNWPQEPQAFIEALEREVEEHERDPDSSLSWEEVRAELRAKRRS